MKVAYIFSTTGHTVSYKLGKMILPQLEEHRHGVEVVGMFFFDDNTYALRKGDPLGERLSVVAREQGILLMLCDQCAIERELATPDAAGGYRPVNTVERGACGMLSRSLRSTRDQSTRSGNYSITVRQGEDATVLFFIERVRLWGGVCVISRTQTGANDFSSRSLSNKGLFI